MDEEDFWESDEGQALLDQFCAHMDEVAMSMKKMAASLENVRLTVAEMRASAEQGQCMGAAEMITRKLLERVKDAG